MPWRESRVLDARLEFVASCLSGEVSMTQACEAYGVCADARASGRADCCRVGVDRDA